MITVVYTIFTHCWNVKYNEQYIKDDCSFEFL